MATRQDPPDNIPLPKGLFTEWLTELLRLILLNALVNHFQAPMLRHRLMIGENLGVLIPILKGIVIDWFAIV